MKKITTLLLLLGASMAHADLQTLDNHELQSVEAQAGADLSLKLALNHNVLTDAQLQAGTAPTFNCNDLPYCRLAISFNKRFVQKYTNTGGSDTRPTDTDDLWTVAASDPTEGNPGHKLWLVFKGMQGTVNIQKLGLDGVDLEYKRKSDNKVMIKPAIQLNFDASKPIQIRDLGFDALSIEQDKVLSYYKDGKLIEETSSIPGDYGFLKSATYSSKSQTTDAASSPAPTSGPTGSTANNYDTGKETGFLGLRMNGNLALQGKVMMFGCDSSHPRC